MPQQAQQARRAKPASPGVAGTGAASELPAAPAQASAPAMETKSKPKPHFRLAREAHARTHLTHLLQTSTLEDPSTSGRSERMDEQTGFRSITLDLTAPQPAGPESLYAAKVEITPVALLNVGNEIPFSRPSYFAKSSDGQVEKVGTSFAYEKITNLGENIVVYAQMNKCKLRVIHIKTGARALLSASEAEKVSPRPVLKCLSSEEHRDEQGRPDGWSLFALVGSAEDESASGPPALVMWRVPASWGEEECPFDTSGKLVSLENLHPSHSTRPAFWMSLRGSDVALTSSKDVTQAFSTGVGASGAVATEELCDFTSSADAVSWTRSGGILASMLSTKGGISITADHKNEDNAAEWVIPWPASLRKQQSNSISYARELCSNIHDSATKQTLRLPNAIVLGFNNNTIISIFNIGYCGQVDPIAEICLEANADHFNLVTVHEASSGPLLLVASSYRASLFCIPLLGPSGVDHRDIRKGIQWDAIWNRPLDPGTHLSLGRIREYALNEPCVSMSAAEVSTEPRFTRIFMVHPNGIQLADLPPFPKPSDALELNAQIAAAADGPKSDDDSEVEIVSVKRAGNVDQQAVGKAEEPAVEIPDGSKAVAPKEAEPIEKAAQPPVETSAKATEPTSANQAIDAIAIQEAINNALKASIAQYAIPAIETGLQTSLRTIDEAMQRVSLEWPEQIALAFGRQHVTNRLTSVVADTITQPAQRAAVETVRQVLAPHFDQMLEGLSRRLEQQVEQEMLQIRKDIVAEQSQALMNTTASMSEMAEEMRTMRVQLDSLQRANAELIRVVKEERQDFARAMNAFSEAAQIQKASVVRQQSTPSVAQSLQTTQTMPLSAEDAFLSVLSLNGIEVDTTPLLMLLADLKRQYSSPASALEGISQPVTLALLHRLATCLLNFAHSDGSADAQRKSIDAATVVPWLEACANKLDRHDFKIASHYNAASSRILGQLFEANSLLSRPGGKAPWFPEVLMRITQPLIRT